MYLNNFVTQSLGDWVSQRTYQYCKDGEVQTISLLTTKMSITAMDKDAVQQVLNMHDFDVFKDYPQIFGMQIKFRTHETGDPEKVVRIGDMGIVFVSNDDMESGEIFRDKGYFSKDPVKSKYVTTHAGLETATSYNGGTYIETIEFPKFKIDNFDNPVPYNTHRTRQTVGYRENEITLVGQYLETRVA